MCELCSSLGLVRSIYSIIGCRNLKNTRVLTYWYDISIQANHYLTEHLLCSWYCDVSRRGVVMTWLWIETIRIPDTLVNNKITGCSFLHNHGHGIFHRFWSRAVCVFFGANSFEQHMVLRVNRNVNRTRQQKQTRSWYFGRGRWTLNATVESFMMPKSQTFKFYCILCYFFIFFFSACNSALEGSCACWSWDGGRKGPCTRFFSLRRAAKWAELCIDCSIHGFHPNVFSFANRQKQRANQEMRLWCCP